jgi:hypothetical protein
MSAASPVAVAVIIVPSSSLSRRRRVSWRAASSTQSASSSSPENDDFCQMGASAMGGSDEAGRGLQLIDSYADDWGWFQVNGPRGGHGKYIWCELDAKPR